MRVPTNLPSASKLQLAMTCAASQSLGIVDTAWESGEAGKAKHAALAWRVMGAEACPAEVDAATMAWLDALDEETLAPLKGCRDEPSYALDVATGKARLLGYRLERAYGEAKPGEMFGSADYVRTGGDEVLVVDLKTGMSDVPHPSRNAQLRFLALAAASAHGVSRARVGILHAPEGRAHWWSWASFDAFDLATIAAELRTLVERIGYARNDVAAGKTPHLTVGEHCAHCPARFGCPARVAMAKRLAGEPEAVVMDLKALLTPETAALAYSRWRAAKKAIDEVGGALHALAKETPIALGDGRVWGPVESEREEIDAEQAWLVLSEKYGGEVARAAMSLKTSKAGIERAAKALRESMRGATERPRGVPEGKVTQKALAEDALAALRAAGCVTTKTVTEYEEHQAALPAAS